ncbi:thioredoxin family protein [Anoxybacillus rupiensis]|uniref:Thioredoxin family protein n=1 Tax=Anoxybacteroides rupiense TaxID=311460 RepID=A0ABD5IV88_9BACL|nr:MULTISPECIES: thioredoxin family protein [Anoxybacillus]KXG09992.1 Thioredoxin [Anoxybacillus sp. P3H1B]MBB3907678.1 thiol-disulfide isomerase/thioredoxin [Anoxybacillus rupiensis]MBS2771658.1 thioredoxin family protein [Anoxybacillus rupiensis]MDE8564253.1 thioredoxin family protein [Anoxybacillus rupiensis]MED5052230.1 thioredoxin family protein [Anoxybacillus rupiensis]
MKKILIFGTVILALFLAISWITSYQQTEKAKDNPYKKEKLDPATIEQLDDPNYKNLILPDELAKKLDNHETVTVYFYSPTCPHCEKTTPIVVPLAKKMGIDLKLFNLLEFEDGWDTYHIDGTPTIVHFENGKEVKRIDGYREENVFRDWFESIK